jgi:hypothetical protein
MRLQMKSALFPSPVSIRTFPRLISTSLAPSLVDADAPMMSRHHITVAPGRHRCHRCNTGTLNHECVINGWFCPGTS